MADEGFKRKLTSILSADAVGYSRLMEDDEEATVRTLTSYREVIATLIKQNNGMVIDSPGDNLLADFVSVVDAVQCAVSIQNEINARNVNLPENRRMAFRIGINIGDVIQEGERIYGDGVNIAARLEGLATPGGICISKTAFDQIERKLPYGYEFIGDQTVKNISKPVGAYRVLMEPRVTVAGAPEEKKPAPVRRKTILMGAVAVLILAVAVGIWQFYMHRPSVEPASKEKMALPLPDLSSIAVLPFVNMSDDPKQEFLSDGITGEIITALSKARHLFVISRQSTFFYKGKPVKVKQVSEELGVRYVLEGSVQRSGERIRINIQLIDALTGRQIWAELYERELKDIFALQDEITMKILMAIRVKLTEGEQSSMSGAEKYFKGKQGLDCYLKILEIGKYLDGHNSEANRAARPIVEEVIAICPENPVTCVTVAYFHWMEYWLGPVQSRRESIKKGIEMAQKAIAMDDSIALAHSFLGMFYNLMREYDKAIAEGERALALTPGGASVNLFLAMSLYYTGRSEEAIPLFQKAARLDPVGSTGLYLNFGHALRTAGRFEEAISAFTKSLQREPDNIFAHLGLAATYSMMGREQEARAEGAEVIRINPNFSLDSLARALPFKDQSMIDNYIGALSKAGLK
jgi:adenylate cyclase